MSEGSASKVTLYVYDLSQGFAAQMSQALLGKQINGVWHTSIVVDGVEYFYGGGIQEAMPGTTPYGRPVDIIELGETHIPREVLQEYIEEMRRVFTPEQYDLFRNNCNHFSDDLATFLTGSGIPDHITSLPSEVLSTPMGALLAPMLTGVESQLGSVHQGDAPLQLQSPVPGVTLPQYQPDPSRPATQPASSTAAKSSNGAAPSQASPASTDSTIDRQATQHKQAAEKEQSQAGPTASKASSEHKAGDGSVASNGKAAAKAQFEEMVRVEFARIMAAGALSANEAAVQAVALASARAESLDVSGLRI